MRLSLELCSDNSTTARINNLIKVIESGGLWLCQSNGTFQYQFSKEFYYKHNDNSKPIALTFHHDSFNTDVIFFIDNEQSIKRVIYNSLVASYKDINDPQSKIDLMLRVKESDLRAYRRDLTEVERGTKKFCINHITRARGNIRVRANHDARTQAIIQKSVFTLKDYKFFKQIAFKI